MYVNVIELYSILDCFHEMTMTCAYYAKSNFSNNRETTEQQPLNEIVSMQWCVSENDLNYDQIFHMLK